MASEEAMLFLSCGSGKKGKENHFILQEVWTRYYEDKIVYLCV